MTMARGWLKRYGLAVALLFAGILFAVLSLRTTPANAQGSKFLCCHNTGSSSNPNVLICVDDDSKKLEGHLNHGDTCVADADCIQTGPIGPCVGD